MNGQKLDMLKQKREARFRELLRKDSLELQSLQELKRNFGQAVREDVQGENVNMGTGSRAHREVEKAVRVGAVTHRVLNIVSHVLEPVHKAEFVDKGTRAACSWPRSTSRWPTRCAEEPDRVGEAEARAEPGAAASRYL